MRWGAGSRNVIIDTFTLWDVAVGDGNLRPRSKVTKVMSSGWEVGNHRATPSGFGGKAARWAEPGGGSRLVWDPHGDGTGGDGGDTALP